ncbi:MAG: undecaprenyl-phosphate galactose phosphotransferase WbaP [Lentisphaeria bacterium]|nr:undecaprenyl-phosphate galactose phosphotransferase WbaP [Lentisphaeria bacterium]
MRSARIRILILMLADIVCFTLVPLVVLWSVDTFMHDIAISWESYRWMWPFIGVFVGCNVFIRLYHGDVAYPGAALGAIEELRRIFFSSALTYILLFAYLALSLRVQGVSRSTLILSWLLTFLFLPIFRWWARCLMKRSGIGQINVLIAGAGVTGTMVALELRRDRYFGFNVVGFLDDSPALRKTCPVEDIPVVGSLRYARKAARKYNTDYMICCIPITLVTEMLESYSKYFKHVMIIPDNRVFPISWAYPIYLSGFSGMEIRNQLLLPMPRMAKGLLELVVSLIAFVTLLPVFLILAFLVKVTSRGPIFYRARRLGVNRTTVRVLKFRTMYIDADQRLETLLAEDPEMERQWREKFKLDNDPRVTPLGRFLRKTSLDELPQFWNVLTGEMSVIGPRPIVEAEVKYYGDRYALLSRVKPGITGLWQVSGRSELDYPQRVNLDISYIMNWTIWMDYYIFLKTVKEVILCRGAR